MMKNHFIRDVFITVGLVAGPVFAQLQIYLPREVTICDSNIVLERIAIINGDPNLVQRARPISLGRLLVPGQQTIVDRTTLLSRLASCQIEGTKVRLLGAQAVSVRRTGTTIAGQELADLATRFVKTQLGQHPIAKAEPIATPAEIHIDPNRGDIRLVPRIVAGGPQSGSIRVRVSVVCGSEQIASTDVLVRLLYNTQKVVASRDLPAGTVLGTQDITIQQQTSSRPPELDWKAPYGLVLNRQVSAGEEIRPDDIERPTRQVTVRRNELVMIRIQRPGVLVTGQGKAMSDGRAGDVIKVRNVESNRIIMCQVKDDGTVEPVI